CWNPADSSAHRVQECLSGRLSADHIAWTCVLRFPGLAVFSSGHDASRWVHYRVGNTRGVVLGTLFRRTDAAVALLRPDALSDAEANRILATRGGHLIEAYWGRYVAICQGPGDPYPWVVRDPSGVLPCLISTFSGVQLIYSDLADCVHLGAGRLR